MNDAADAMIALNAPIALSGSTKVVVAAGKVTSVASQGPDPEPVVPVSA